MTQYDSDAIVGTKLRESFLDYDQTAAAARAQNNSIEDYLESLWGCEGQARRVMEEILTNCSFSEINTVVEIGPGSGRFLSKAIDLLHPRRYEIYETARPWAEWLSSHFDGVIAHEADGRSLKFTDDATCDLVHAHGVFVYLPMLISFEYLREMIRVCRPGGHVVFDIFPESEFKIDQIREWLATDDRFPTIMPQDSVRGLFKEAGFAEVHTCNRRLAAGSSHYLVFRKADPS
jgi:SAM-dependent methyltransferase